MAQSFLRVAMVGMDLSNVHDDAIKACLVNGFLTLLGKGVKF